MWGGQLIPHELRPCAFWSVFLPFSVPQKKGRVRVDGAAAGGSALLCRFAPPCGGRGGCETRAFSQIELSPLPRRRGRKPSHLGPECPLYRHSPRNLSIDKTKYGR